MLWFLWETMMILQKKAFYRKTEQGLKKNLPALNTSLNRSCQFLLRNQSLSSRLKINLLKDPNARPL